MSKQSDELRRYFSFHNIKTKEIADALGLQSPSVSNMLAGRDSLGAARCYRLHEVYGFDLEFLKTGRGQLVPDITMTPDQLKARTASKPVVIDGAAPLPPMVDSQADMVDILLGQVQQLTALVGQIRAENIALRKELNEKESLG